MAILQATRINDLPKEELLKVISSLTEEHDGLKGQLIDNELDPENNVMDQFVKVEKVEFSTHDDREQTRIMVRKFAREAVFQAAEQAFNADQLTKEQDHWITDMDLLISLN